MKNWKQMMSIHVIRESDVDNTFSTTFDRKLRSEMGRYEATSLIGSKFGFFRRGRIIAFCSSAETSLDGMTYYRYGGDDWTDDITRLFD